MGRTISGSISLPCPGFFSPFPHGTGYAIGDRLYLALRSGLRRFTRGSTCSVLLRYHLNLGWFTSTGLSPSTAGLSNPVPLTFLSTFFYQPRMQTPSITRLVSIRSPHNYEGDGSGGPTTPTGKPIGLGSSAFARRYLRNLFDFFSSGYLDVSVHQVASK